MSPHHEQNGLTPLHLAAQEDRVNVAEVLLNHGADINLQTKVNLFFNTHTSITLRKYTQKKPNKLLILILQLDAHLVAQTLL